MASIRKRSWTAPDGAERTAWQVDYRDNGGKRRSRQFARKREAEAWLTQAGWEVAAGIHTPDRESVTVREAVALWLRTADAAGLEPSTTRAYESTARLHILPFLGDERLSRLRKPTIEGFKDDLLAAGRSKARAGRAVRFLTMIIAEAERRGLVAQNVAAGVRVIRSSREAERVVIPTQAELKAMIAAASDDLRPLLLTAMLTGLRASELRGLPWSAVDLKRGVLSVVQRADEANRIGAPKSGAGRRSIPMSPKLVTELRKWKLRCKPSELGLVFPSPEAKVWSYANLMNRAFWPLQVTAGVADEKRDPDGEPIMEARYSLHALRHTAASLWIRQGIDLKRLTTWIGHASVQTTIDTYGHLMFDEVGDAALVQAAERALLG